MLNLIKKITVNDILKVFLELAIVFFGVYLAFQLNNLKEDNQDKKLRSNIYSLMLYDFKERLAETARAKKMIENKVLQYQEEIDAGQNPLPPIFEDLDLETNMMVMSSAFNSGYLENLNTKYVSNLARGSDFLKRVVRLLETYNRNVRSALQYQDYKSDGFYDQGGKLLERYSWIRDDQELLLKYLGYLEAAYEQGAIPDTEALIGP